MGLCSDFSWALSLNGGIDTKITWCERKLAGYMSYEEKKKKKKTSFILGFILC